VTPRNSDTAAVAFQKFKEAWQRQLVADPKMLLSALGVGIAISWHLNHDSRDAWPGITELATLTGHTRMTVLRAVKWLEQRGHVRVKRGWVSKGRRAKNRYFPVIKLQHDASNTLAPDAPDDTRVVSQLRYQGGITAMIHEPSTEPSTEPQPNGIDRHRCSSEKPKAGKERQGRRWSSGGRETQDHGQASKAERPARSSSPTPSSFGADEVQLVLDAVEGLGRIDVGGIIAFARELSEDISGRQVALILGAAGLPRHTKRLSMPAHEAVNAALEKLMTATETERTMQ
jgi:hypothetical protein